MKVSVKERMGGTICAKCSSGVVMEAKGGKQGAYCNAFKVWLPPIEQCSRFTERGMLNLYELERMAWIIDSGAPKEVGFKGGVKFARPGDERHGRLVDGFD